MIISCYGWLGSDARWYIHWGVGCTRAMARASFALGERTRFACKGQSGSDRSSPRHRELFSLRTLRRGAAMSTRGAFAPRTHQQSASQIQLEHALRAGARDTISLFTAAALPQRNALGA